MKKKTAALNKDVSLGKREEKFHSQIASFAQTVAAATVVIISRYAQQDVLHSQLLKASARKNAEPKELT